MAQVLRTIRLIKNVAFAAPVAVIADVMMDSRFGGITGHHLELLPDGAVLVTHPKITRSTRVPASSILAYEMDEVAESTEKKNPMAAAHAALAAKRAEASAQ